MAVLDAAQSLGFGNLGALATLAIITTGLTFVYCSYVVIYRLYFHPLAHFPGPLLNRISPESPIQSIPFLLTNSDTQLPITLHLVRGRLPFYIKSLHDIYGPTIRISPTELSFTSPLAWKDIYGSRPGHKNFHKDPIHAFLEQEGIVRSYVDVFSGKMREFAKLGDVVDLVEWFTFTTFDIIGHMALGEPFDCLISGAFEQATRRLATADSWSQKQLLRLIPKSIASTRRHHLEYSREKIMKRLSQPQNQQKDFIHYLQQQQEAGSIPLDELIVNGALFIIAGTETTAGFLAGLFNQLLRNRQVLNRLTAEIRTAFPNDEDIRFEELIRLPYLTAVIEEGLRIFPSAPIGFTRTVPVGGDTVDGVFVPEGTTVSVTMWASTHSQRNFKDPYKFIPERCMDKENSTDEFGASKAFSLGPRGCIGRNLSYMEMRLIIGKLLWHNDVYFAGSNESWNPDDDHKNMKVYTNWIKPRLFVKLVPRKFSGGNEG